MLCRILMEAKRHSYWIENNRAGFLLFFVCIMTGMVTLVPPSHRSSTTDHYLQPTL